jgi:uracil-DNA glycosylase
MIKVVFVGDEPSSMNLHPHVAFVGAKCFQTKWIKVVNPDYYICLNSCTATDLYTTNMLSKNGFSVIALGKNASERLTVNHIHHFTLPHPSGLNRKNNDKLVLWKALLDAHDYVREA